MISLMGTLRGRVHEYLGGIGRGRARLSPLSWRSVLA
ncbi:MAG: hypothetical protein AVDCRST_MAG29-867 [uncultured Nocardioidaceae bacterium]|uniref:Uncharacterized protein n=1 Tax=uncultured Nocardioidaceae bacterium TaxID=253824 RepID=A0A6J4LCI2_9ACTN|nr:MAG: hypothetical protein AVDCRST_MAG46-788 [uncultured Nocardioidaceae bacterium]CAA9328151.1 MAG: hypothetical protein AVDCRST_MAG29-867 [uncultured Nocardioidaceae bacterium]